MNLIGMVHFEIEKAERLYTMMVPMGSPYGEALEVVQELAEKIKAMAQEAEQKAAQEESEKKSQDS